MALVLSDNVSIELSSLQPLWHRKAPRHLMHNCPSDEPLAKWDVWRDYLATRKAPQGSEFLLGKQPALLWGWPGQWQRDALRRILQKPKILAEVVLAEEGVAAPDLSLALQLVGLAYGLPELAATLPGELWWELMEKLHDMAVEAEQHRVDWPADPRDVVRQQLLAGELSLALGVLFPEVRALRELRKQGRGAFSEALIELTDGRGMPHAQLLPVLGPLFGCWTRARWIGERLRRGAWSAEADAQYQWLVRHAIRLVNPDGTFALSSLHAEEMFAATSLCQRSTKKLVAKATELAGDGGDCAAAAQALGRGVVPDDAGWDRDDLPAPSLNSGWSGVAVMADGWSPKNVRIAVAYADDPIHIDVFINREQFLAGAWTTTTTCDGKPVRVAGDWEFLCWEKNKRHDFLEIGIQLSEGLRLERQIVFGREDLVLYLCDMVISNDGARRRIQHTLSLRLDDGVQWRPQPDTRDGMIAGRKYRAAVLPLALPEWRSDPRGGSLEVKNGRFTLAQESNGRALCCPLFFDLNRKRARKNRTWRQLTVAENLEVVPRDVAVGYRVQSGDDQWLFYRSLAPVGNRTLLGHNIAGEFCAGRFLDTGKFKEWIEIESV